MTATRERQRREDEAGRALVAEYSRKYRGSSYAIIGGAIAIVVVYVAVMIYFQHR